jgi:large repetitive protein
MLLTVSGSGLAVEAYRRFMSSYSQFMRPRRWFLDTAKKCLALCFVLPGLTTGASAFQVPVDSTGLGYTNVRVAKVPWSVHVVQVARSNSVYELHSVHATGAALGLETLSDQISVLSPSLGIPVAAINGDFYQRDRAYAGAPRGLQVVDGELLSGPGKQITFWLDVNGEAHAAKVSSKFEITWPDGTITPFRLNGERSPNGVELFTPAIGRSTRTSGGRELVFERADGSPWLPLRVGKVYVAKVSEVRETGNTKILTNTLVLSLGSGAARRIASVEPGAILRISTATLPALHGVKTALSGGPILVHNGRRQHADSGLSDSYEFSSMFERHPRAAIGWNQDSVFLVEVDGRQRGLSVGMTLDELANFMVDLGCQEAMNCDGGGSATLWFQGEVRNSPCDRAEREIANSLVIVKKKPGGASSSAPAGQ